MTNYTPRQVRHMLIAEMVSRSMTQNDLALHLRVSPPFINLVLSGKRRPTGAVLKWLGLKQVVTYSYQIARKRRTVGK